MTSLKTQTEYDNFIITIFNCTNPFQLEIYEDQLNNYYNSCIDLNERFKIGRLIITLRGYRECIMKDLSKTN